MKDSATGRCTDCPVTSDPNRRFSCPSRVVGSLAHVQRGPRYRERPRASRLAAHPAQRTRTDLPLLRLLRRRQDGHSRSLSFELGSKPPRLRASSHQNSRVFSKRLVCTEAVRAMPLSSAVVILAVIGDLEDRRTACSSASQVPEGARAIPRQYANRGIDFLGPVTCPRTCSPSRASRLATPTKPWICVRIVALFVSRPSSPRPLA